MEYVIFIMEIIGTIAFASSGALTAIRKNMDIFGVNVLAVVTAVGGGVIRDFLIDDNIPIVFRQPVYVIVAIITCNFLFVTIYTNRELLANHFIVIYEKVMLIIDAVGLGTFTAVGINAGMSSQYYDNPFFILFLGVLTGIGGGIVRDLLAAQKPCILHKHVYACASILGASVCIMLWPLGDILAMWCGSFVIVAIRLLASRFHWNLPKIQS